MKSSMHPQARKEFLAAIDYYNSKEADCVFIYAIMHNKREPGYWYDRLSS